MKAQNLAFGMFLLLLLCVAFYFHSTPFIFSLCQAIISPNFLARRLSRRKVCLWSIPAILRKMALSSMALDGKARLFFISRRRNFESLPFSVFFLFVLPLLQGWISVIFGRFDSRRRKVHAWLGLLRFGGRVARNALLAVLQVVQSRCRRPRYAIALHSLLLRSELKKKPKTHNNRTSCLLKIWFFFAASSSAFLFLFLFRCGACGCWRHLHFFGHIWVISAHVCGD